MDSSWGEPPDQQPQEKPSDWRSEGKDSYLSAPEKVNHSYPRSEILKKTQNWAIHFLSVLPPKLIAFIAFSFRQLNYNPPKPSQALLQISLK